MDFDENNFWKKKYSKGMLYFIKNFDFQANIPGRQNKKQQDFVGKSALLQFAAREGVIIYITNENLETNFKKIDKDRYLIDIKKFVDFCKSLKNKTGFDLVHAFITNNLDVKNTYFSQKDYSEILKRDDFHEFLKTLKEEDLVIVKQILPKIKNLDISQISNLTLLDELKNRNLNPKEFFEFAHKFLTSKDELEINGLQNLTKTIDFKKIENVLKIWEANKTNANEVLFWHKFLKSNPWIISQVFAASYAIFQNEFYVGGHHSGNAKGAKNTDFGYKNKFSQNIAIIEIKTPVTDLVKKTEYNGRLGIYPMSDGLMGSISQVLNQKDQLQKNFLQNNKEKNFEVWNPKIILIIGSNENEKLNDNQRACFELFKNSQKDFEIVTFDDLFEKIKNFKDIFKYTID